jgi:ADP-ribose pyrophosphatase YjhB (NUDIX family)
VKPGELLVKALKREVYEGTGLRVQIGSLLGVLDRRDKGAITLLFAAIPKNSSVKAKQKPKEIKETGFLRNPCRTKLHAPLDTSGLPQDVLSKKRRKFSPQRINFRRLLRSRQNQNFVTASLKIRHRSRSLS